MRILILKNYFDVGFGQNTWECDKLLRFWVKIRQILNFLYLLKRMQFGAIVYVMSYVFYVKINGTK